MPEKRDIKRHKRRYSIRFGIDSPTRIGFTEDISANGLFIKTTNIAPIGTSLVIDLTLSNNDTVSIEGVVRWSKKIPPQMIHMVNKGGMGVEIKGFIAGEALYQNLIAELHAKNINQAPLNCVG